MWTAPRHVSGSVRYAAARFPAPFPGGGKPHTRGGVGLIPPRSPLPAAGLVVGSDGATLRIATRCPPADLARVNLLMVGDQSSYAEPAHALAGAGVGDVVHPLLSADVLANVGTGAGVMRARGPMVRGPAPK